jgi:hypothetical protein
VRLFLVSCAVVLGALSVPTLQRPSGSSDRHLRIDAASFRTASGAPFQWRGISAFRLVEMVAHGQRADAAAFLDWAATRHLTVVRVFTMARSLFDLSPADGVRALPDLLEMAADRGLHVEIVALVDTKELATGIDAHVKAVGGIASQHSNALVEIANEPAHQTQARAIHDPRELKRLAALVPPHVPVSLGSAEENEAYADAGYATYHFPRAGSPASWGHVVRLAGGAALLKAWRKPVVSDEPIGAGPIAVAGRRDNDPDRFRAAALLTRMAGLGATFHYEQGLQAKIPTGTEARCFDAWNEAWTLLPADVERRGAFRTAGDAGAAVSSFDATAASGVFEVQRESTAYVLVLNASKAPAVTWNKGWRSGTAKQLGAVWLLTATRAAP